MKFKKIESGSDPRWVNLSAVRFLWIEELPKKFAKHGDRFYVVAEHDIYLRGFKTYAEAELYLEELIADLE